MISLMTFWSKPNDHRYAEIDAIVNFFFNLHKKIRSILIKYGFLVTWYEHNTDTVLHKRQSLAMNL